MQVFQTKTPWYGKLETSSGTTKVIFDAKITAPQGRIYLYNAERRAIVQYVEEKVRLVLKDVDKEEQKAIKKELEKEWKAARREFLSREFIPLKMAKVEEKKQPDRVDDEDIEFEIDDFEEFDSDSD